jgi:Tfp pilus assembly protein FimT
MVELIVVTVILVVLAGAMLPRLGSGDSRRVRLVAESMADLLSIAARRDALTSQRVCLDFDQQTEGARLLVYVVKEDGVAEWREDILSSRVGTHGAVVQSAFVNGIELDNRTFRIEFTPSDRRPVVALTLADASGRYPWRVELNANGAQAVARPFDPAAPPATDGTIDLDATGMEDSPW